MTKIKRKNVKLKTLMGTLVLLGQCLVHQASAESLGESSESLSSQTSAELSISPKQCIALHQGQVCYQNVIIEWRADKMGDYCLFSKKLSTPINCWKKSAGGKLVFDFQSAHSVVYQLRQMNNNLDVATAEMTVAWVYGNKKRRRASWRLF